MALTGGVTVKGQESDEKGLSVGFQGSGADDGIIAWTAKTIVTVPTTGTIREDRGEDAR